MQVSNSGGSITPVQLPSLTGLRIVAAMWVLVHHFSGVIFGYLPILSFLEPVAARGGVGVDLFFILSGFILAHTYMAKFQRQLDIKGCLRFLRLRIARVYPVHIVTLITAGALAAGAGLLGMSSGSDDMSLGAFVQNLFLVQAWFGQPYSWNAVAWSVSAEWFAYLLFPIAAVFVAKVRNFVVACVGVLVPIAAYAALTTFVFSESLADRPDNVLLRISASFLAGCFLYRVFEQTRPRPGVWRWLTPLAVLAIVALCYVDGLRTFAVLPFLCLLILGLANGGSALHVLLSTPVFVLGGHVSYSFYMIHGQILSVARALLPEPDAAPAWPIGLALLSATVAVVFFTAWLLYRAVEEPSRKMIRGKAGSASGRATEAVDATR